MGWAPMIAKPLVSVLTPTHNRRAFIGQYLKYLRRQDYPYNRIEVLVADDGGDSVEDLFRGLERVRYIRLSEPKPLGFKRNLLAAESRGEIIVHMDDDDYYPPTRISHAVARLLGSEALIAGNSEIYMYDTRADKVFVSGPFGPNHATNGTFAYRRAYLEDHRFDSDAFIRDEAAFTDDFTAPMVQLDPRASILMIRHEANTWNKGKTAARPTRLRLKDLVRDPNDRRFYKSRVPKPA